MSEERFDSLARTVRRQSVVIAGLAGALVLLLAGGQGERRPESPSGVERAEAAVVFPQYTAGGDKLYRIQQDGSVDYLVVDFAQGTVEGIPGWARVQIDHQMSRDRMGNIIKVRR